MSDPARDSTAQPYAGAWRDYRQRRSSVAVMVIGMVGLTCFGLDPSRETARGLMFWSIAWAVLIALVARWLTWRCPRCQRNFLPIRNRVGRYGRDRCDNCGLPKWSMRDPDSDAPSS